MTPNELNEKKAERASLLNKAKAVLSISEAANRAPSAEEDKAINGWVADAEKISATIATEEAAIEARQNVARRTAKIDDMLGGSQGAALGGLAHAAEGMSFERYCSTFVPGAVKDGYRRVKNFEGTPSERAAQAYAMGQFVRYACWGSPDAKAWLGDNGFLAAMSTTDNAGGGALVPNPLAASLIRLVEQYGVIRANAMNVPVPNGTLSFPRRTGGLTVYAPGEAGTITASNPTYANTSLVSRKLATITPVPSELMNDAILALGDLIAQEISYAFAYNEDSCGFNGTGSAAYFGIQGVLPFAGSASIYDCISGNTAFSTLDMADFLGAWGQLPQYAQASGRAAWYISRVGAAQSIHRLMYAQGGVNIVETANGPQERFLGLPIVFSQVLNATVAAQVSTKILAVGDLYAGVTLGETQGIQIATDNSVYFASDQVAIRGLERVDIKCNSFDSTSTAGPMIVMKTPAS